jgi:hypothetical protein
MAQRTPTKQTLKDWLIAFTDRLHRKTNAASPGPKRDGIQMKLRQSAAAAHIDDWINSVGLQRPK